MPATPKQGVSAELLLGSSTLPSNRVLPTHQAELLVPPRGRRGESGYHSLRECAPGTSQGTGSGPWGRLVTHLYSKHPRRLSITQGPCKAPEWTLIPRSKMITGNSFESRVCILANDSRQT